METTKKLENQIKLLKTYRNILTMYVGEVKSYDVNAQMATSIKARLTREKENTGKVYTTSLVGNKMYITRIEDEPIR